MLCMFVCKLSLHLKTAVLLQHAISTCAQMVTVAIFCRWFNKYAGWGPGQLDREVAAGVWFTVAASSEVILNQKSLARSEMWHSILDLMGGDFAALSASVKEAYPDNLPRDGS